MHDSKSLTLSYILLGTPATLLSYQLDSFSQPDLNHDHAINTSKPLIIIQIIREAK
jgi:hypothetical protein